MSFPGFPVHKLPQEATHDRGHVRKLVADFCKLNLQLLVHVLLCTNRRCQAIAGGETRMHCTRTEENAYHAHMVQSQQALPNDDHFYSFSTVLHIG